MKTQFNERGAATTFAYWPNRKLQSVVAPTPSGTATTDHYYDNAGRENRTVMPPTSDALNAPRPETDTTFNPNGSVATVQRTSWNSTTSTDTMSVVSTYYNAFGEPIKVVGPRSDGTVKQVSRTAYNRFGQATDSKRLRTGFTDDSANPAAWITTSSSSFDEAGNLLSQSNPTGDPGTAPLTATYHYDVLNRLDQQLNDPSAPGHTVVFGYDFEGRQTTRTDKTTGNTTIRTVTTNYNPDSTVKSQIATTSGVVGASTLATCNYPANATAGTERATGYDVDGNLLVTRTLNGGDCSTGTLQGQTTNIYGDDRGWITQATQIVNGPSGQLSRTQQFTYKRDGQWATAQHNGQLTTFTSDASGPVTQIDDWRGKITTFNYFKSGQIKGQTVGTAATAAFTWKINGLADTLNWTVGTTGTGSSLRSHTVNAYDDTLRANESVSVRKQGAGTPAYDNGTASYSYDQLDRLTKFVNPFTDPDAHTQLQTRYALDDGGNIKTATMTKYPSDAAWSTSTSTYSGSQLTKQEVTKDDSSAPAGSTTTYTPNELGQEGSRTGRTTKYDGLGHVISVDDTTTANDDVTYVYDAADHLLSRSEPNGAAYGRPVFTAYFFWPGSSPAEETDAAGHSITQYVPGQGGAALAQKTFALLADGTVNTADTGAAAWLLNDLDGNPATIIDDNGNVLSQNAWDPYGQLTKAGSTDQNQKKTGSPLGFGGALQDGATGSLILGARQYDPKTARFTTPDYFIAAQLDIKLGSDELTGNRYLFAAANPVGFYENGYWPSLKSVFKKVTKVAKAVATNKLVRSVAIGIAVGVVVAAACGTTAGLGCAVAAGAISGGLDALTTCKRKAGVASCVKHVAIAAAVGAATAAVTYGAGKLISGRLGAAARAAEEDIDDAARAAAKDAPAIKPGASGGETAGKAFPKSVRDAALEENPSTCVYCHMETEAPQIDHSVPRSLGGDATIENAQTTCPWCNASKGAREFPVNPPPGYEGPWPPPWWDQ